MATRSWTTGQRILGAWLVIALVAAVGWVAGTFYAGRYAAGLDRDVICANTGVALGDTVLRGAERARRDSAELVERNCASRYALARQGREDTIHISLAIGVLLGVLVVGLFTLGWVVRGAWRWLKEEGPAAP